MQRHYGERRMAPLGGGRAARGRQRGRGAGSARAGPESARGRHPQGRRIARGRAAERALVDPGRVRQDWRGLERSRLAAGQEYARRLGVKLTPVPVSHETKVPVLAANQVDMTISPLAETPERLKVVDFVLYSATSVCMFGRAGNDKLAQVRSVDDLNRPGITIAYFTGGAEEAWVKQRPNATLRAVANSGATAPIEEIMARRADAAPINRVPWVGLKRKVPGLQVFPAEANCQQSTEKASPVGLAVDKGQDAYLAWLRQVAVSMKPQLDADETRVIEQLP